MLLNDYLICLRCTRGSAINRKIRVGRSVSGRVQSGGVSPRTVQLGAAAPDRNIPFPLMTKGERFIRCKIEILGERAQRPVYRGSIPKGRYPLSLMSNRREIETLMRIISMNVIMTKCCHQCWCCHQLQRGGLSDSWLRFMDSWYGLLVFTDVNHWRVIL
jgi:hypothetical protein